MLPENHRSTGQSSQPKKRSTTSEQNIDQGSKRMKATWNDDTSRIFCEVCAEEVNAGNRPNTHFSKIGWINVVRKFHQRSGVNYDQKQLKNKWEKLKSEYCTWKNLVEKETGLGWNNLKNTIDAPNEWWEKQVMVNPIVAKFRNGGIQNLTELEIMFNKIVASSSTAWNPYSVDETIVETDDNLEQVYTNLDDPVIETQQQSQDEDLLSKRKGKKPENVKKSKIGTAKLMQHELKRMVDAMEAFSTSSGTLTSRRTDLPGCSIQECLALLATTPNVEVGSELYMLGTRLFVKREFREMFVALPDEHIRFNWLEQELELVKSGVKR